MIIYGHSNETFQNNYATNNIPFLADLQYRCKFFNATYIDLNKKYYIS